MKELMLYSSLVNTYLQDTLGQGVKHCHLD